MTDEGDESGTAVDGWFAGIDPGDTEAAAARIREGGADSPADWPRLAVESGFVGSEADYYDRLREATVRATREAVRERERADDRQLMHAVRAMDDMARKLV